MLPSKCNHSTTGRFRLLESGEIFSVKGKSTASLANSSSCWDAYISHRVHEPMPKGAGSTRLGTCPFPRRESFSQEWNIEGDESPLLGRSWSVCVSLVFKITTASKRTACYSFSIIHIFLAFINTRGQRVLAKHLGATAEVGTPSDIIGVYKNVLLKPGWSCW